MKKNLFFLFLFIIEISFAQNVRSKDISINYNPSINKIHPEYFIYHESDSITSVFVKIYLSEISNELITLNKFSLSYTFTLFNIEDYSTIFRQLNAYNYEISENKNFIIDKINIQIPWEYRCLLEIIVRNNKGRELSRKYIPVKKTNKISRNDFLLMNDDSILIFKNYINKSIHSTLYTRKNIKNLDIDFIDYKYITKHKDSISKNINESISNYADSTSKSVNNKFKIEFKTTGLYTFSDKSEKIEFFRFLIADSCFPSIHSARLMLEPLKYLNNNLNIDSLKDSKVGAKVELDKYWFFNSDRNIDKAKELIRVFYSRVELSNEFFTASSEGWKTDRGMIFILLGLPNYVYINGDTEVWYYMNRFSKSFEMKFEFMNQNSDEFVLKTDQRTNRVLRIAQREWKKGKIFDYYNFDFVNIK